MGLDLQLVTADEAYHDKDGSMFEETEVIVTTPPSSKVKLPENVDADTGAVYCHAECTFPMLHVGSENKNHEYKCSSDPGECTFTGICSQYRFIPIDGGLLRRILFSLFLLKKGRGERTQTEKFSISKG